MDRGQVSFEEMEHRAIMAKRRTQSFFVQLFSVALTVLSKRILVFFTMSLTAFLFSWAMVEPTVMRSIICSLFAGMVFIPVLLRTKDDEPENHDAD